MNNQPRVLWTLEDIRQIILSDPKTFPKTLPLGKILIATGLFVVLCSLAYPIIDLLPDTAALVVSFIPMIGMFIGAFMLMWVGKRLAKDMSPRQSHPLVGQILRSLSLPVIVIVFGIFLITNLTEPHLTLPLLLIIIGLQIIILSAFTFPKIARTGWFYIIGGLINISLIQFDIEKLDFYFLAYGGLGLVIMGLSVRNYLLNRQ